MKCTKLVIVLAIMTLPLFSTGLKGNPPDECLEMVCPNGEQDSVPDPYTGVWNHFTHQNPDSIRIDTCNDSETFGKRFAKRYYELGFIDADKYLFTPRLRYGRVDSVENINNNPELKQLFEDLEQETGKIYFKGFDEDDISGEHMYFSKHLQVVFKSYQEIDYTCFILSSFDDIESVQYLYRANDNLVGVADETLEPFSIYPNPAKETIRIDIAFSPQNKTMQIINTNGQLMQELQYSEEINISDLPRGSYFLIYGNHISKFIKE